MTAAIFSPARVSELVLALALASYRLLQAVGPCSLRRLRRLRRLISSDPRACPEVLASRSEALRPQGLLVSPLPKRTHPTAPTRSNWQVTMPVDVPMSPERMSSEKRGASALLDEGDDSKPTTRPRKRTRRACDKCSTSRTRCNGELPW